MDFHVITNRGAELVAKMVDGRLVIVPPPVRNAAPVQTAPQVPARR